MIRTRYGWEFGGNGRLRVRYCGRRTTVVRLVVDFLAVVQEGCMSVSMRDLKKHENGGTMCFAEP